MLKDVLVKIYNDINVLDDNELTLVTYEMGTIVYRQLNKVIMMSNIDLLYFPKKKFKYGLLTPSQLTQFRVELFKLIQDRRLDEQTALLVPKELGFIVYSLVNDLKGPQVMYECNFVGITNRFLTRWLLKSKNSESRLLLKILPKIKWK